MNCCRKNITNLFELRHPLHKTLEVKSQHVIWKDGPIDGPGMCDAKALLQLLLVVVLQVFPGDSKLSLNLVHSKTSSTPSCSVAIAHEVNTPVDQILKTRRCILGHFLAISDLKTTSGQLVTMKLSMKRYDLLVHSPSGWSLFPQRCQMHSV